MNLPFTSDQFLEVFRRYNEAIWPAQVGAYFLGIACLAAILSGESWPRRAALMGLSAMWVWNGVGYHYRFFREINPVATMFAALFALQALLLVAAALQRPSSDRPSRSSRQLGWVLVTYALIGYPLLGAALGHSYPASPMFGVAPCPTTIFTFGILMLASPVAPRYLLAIPVLWSVVATSAAINLGMREDLGLTVAAIAAVGVALARGRTSRRAVQRLA